MYAGTSRIVTKVGAGTPVGKTTPADLNGTGNLSLTAPTGGSIVVADVTGTIATLPATAGSSTAPTPSLLGGEGKAFPGQGIAHRSDRANEVARNTEKNKHLNGGIPGGEHGAVNSNAGGNGNAAGTSNNPGNASGGNTGGTGGNTGGGNSDAGGGQSGGGAGQGNGMEFIYFYHPDHLGSTGYVTDEKAQRYEHIAYFPFGETWVQEASATWRVPYQFTSKEMDSETGLYYFGARYYDPRTSVWQSADPILNRYLPNTPRKEGDGVKLLPQTVHEPLARFNLPGMGGVFNSVNLALYNYVGQNPLRYVDPDGRESQSTFDIKPNIDVGVNIGNSTVELKSASLKASWGYTKTQEQTTTIQAPKKAEVPNGPARQISQSEALGIVSDVFKPIAVENVKNLLNDNGINPFGLTDPQQQSQSLPPGTKMIQKVEKLNAGFEVTAQVNSGLQMTVPQGQISGATMSGWELKAQFTVRY